MNTAIYSTHLVSVILFLLIYFIKTALLLSNSKEGLRKFTRISKVPEMMVSFLFLASGIYMIINLPEVSTLLVIKLVCVFLSIPLAIIGFKRGSKPLATLALLLIIAAYGLAEVHKKKAAGPAVAKSVIEGKEIYIQKCVACHGDDGKKQLGDAADLNSSMMRPDEAGVLIKEGKGMMPGFQDQLNSEQVDAVVDYIQTLKEK
jgi:uncharacterized membrane protein SirB2